MALFSHILGHLSTKDLLALSEVDKNCRRLALLSTFKDVVLSFTPYKFDAFLKNTRLSTTVPDPYSPSSYMASCVRRLTVTAEPFNRIVLSEYDNQSSANFGPSLNHLVESASHVFQHSYPNIHVLDWEAPTLIPVVALHSILASPVKHLRLRDATIHDDRSTCLFTSNSALESLCFDVSFTRTPNIRLTSFFKDILILLSSAATLRQLIWIRSLHDEELDIDSDVYVFPHLQSVMLGIISKSDQVIQLLLGPSTRVDTLAMDSMTPLTQTFFASRGYISSLRKFCWLNHNQGDRSVTRYL